MIYQLGQNQAVTKLLEQEEENGVFKLLYSKKHN